MELHNECCFMKRFPLAISNIAWTASEDAAVYELMLKLGIQGLEIAPTRVFEQSPYSHIEEAVQWASLLPFSVPSMQSIWYGCTERLFGTADERSNLLEYSKKAINFASAISCRNLVLGAPRNRVRPDGASLLPIVDFFRELASYALSKGCVIGMEANPSIYNTNFINTTKEAFDLIEAVDSSGFRLNLDIGAMIQNEEPVSLLEGRVSLISHVHVSEPYLKRIVPSRLHKDLACLLGEENYDGYVSIEMSKIHDLKDIDRTMQYVKQVFS